MDLGTYVKVNSCLSLRQAGPLENIRIPKDRDSGKPRAFGFVSYQDQCSVPYACELFNTLKLFGRPINCKPQNAPNDSPRHESSAQSPAQSPSRSFSDEEQYQRNRAIEEQRTPRLQFVGTDVSPYGRTPNGSLSPRRNHNEDSPSPRRHPLMRGNLLPLPPPSLLTQTLLSQQLPVWSNNDGHSSPTGPMRRHVSMYERRPSSHKEQRRQRSHPY